MVEQISLNKLKQMLRQAPIMGEINPLVPICLSPDVRIVDNPQVFINQMDCQNRHDEQPVLLLQKSALLSERFRQVSVVHAPPVPLINEALPHRLQYIRDNLLTSHKVASTIEADILKHRYSLVVLLLIDGLSYEDVVDWGYDVVPCFVDGPSVTFQTDASKQINSRIGFASIVNNPSIAQRLYHLGYHNAFGYTYWQARNNQLAGYMFKGTPDNEVINFESILNLIAEEQIPANSYIQIVREGLDGLAHSKRELRATEIRAATKSIKDDIERLINLLKDKFQSAVFYMTADHGILWKTDHEWQIINQPGSKTRYSSTKPNKNLEPHSVRFECSGLPYYLYTYPYLGKSIRKNDSGVHGGLSYQESFVPFLKIEV